jgi:hypothetical protein
MPWSPDEYLLVYIVNGMKPSTFTSRRLVYVARERLAPETTEPASDGLVAACGLATSCVPPAAYFSMEECFDRWTREPDVARLDAFLAARDCDAVHALLPDVALRAAPCEEPGARCVGAVPVNCPDGGERQVGEPCTADGQRCEVMAPGTGGMAWAQCVGPYPETCDSLSCEGDVLHACGVDVDCAARGQACIAAQSVPGHELPALCARPEPDCTVATSSVCADTSVVRCAAPGHAFAGDQHCARMDLGCFNGQCEAEVAECEEWDPRCDGAVLSFCYRGRRVATDCAAWGATCEASLGLGCQGATTPPP